MPAQQSNISVEDLALDDDEGRTKEIPRQSVLSNLVESSISNFENESVEEATVGEELHLDSVVNSSSNIRIDKQHSTKPVKQTTNNLKDQ